ncbi:hypothetical protein JX266_009048 [Neoarthrinium moseri]|nr:hypothetical protein JX266_009048 [Neoarthrinium moseri]
MDFAPGPSFHRYHPAQHHLPRPTDTPGALAGASASAAAGRAQANLAPAAPAPAPPAIGAGERPGPPYQQPTPSSACDNQRHAPAMRKMRKRKADTQDNERLSKRLSLLNLEQNGQKLYVPVESPQLRPAAGASLRQIPENEHMDLDNSKHKVYIYDLDAELSDGESSSDEGKLVFLPDIEKHLLLNRIPPSVLANKDGELAGMQMVLYNEPKSLTVPAEQDSVRKAIVEARARLRQKQNGDGAGRDALPSGMDIEETPPPRVPNGLNNLANDSVPPAATNNSMGVLNGGSSTAQPWPTTPYDSSDAMEMDID